MRVEVSGGVGVEVEVSGEGRPVVLLHGFPDSGRLWRNQVPALAEAGFKVIVPDLRGYGASDKPGGIEPYGIPALVGDVFGVLDHLRVERAHFVGHDWGAVLGWTAAALMPERVRASPLLPSILGHGSVRLPDRSGGRYCEGTLFGRLLLGHCRPPGARRWPPGRPTVR